MEEENKPQCMLVETGSCSSSFRAAALACSSPSAQGGGEAMGSINRILGCADLWADPGRLFLQPSEFFRRIECGA